LILHFEVMISGAHTKPNPTTNSLN